MVQLIWRAVSLPFFLKISMYVVFFVLFFVFLSFTTHSFSPFLALFLFHALLFIRGGCPRVQDTSVIYLLAHFSEWIRALHDGHSFHKLWWWCPSGLYVDTLIPLTKHGLLVSLANRVVWFVVDATHIRQMTTHKHLYTCLYKVLHIKRESEYY